MAGRLLRASQYRALALMYLSQACLRGWRSPPWAR